MSELKYTTKINELLDSLDATKFPETVDYLAHNNMTEITAYALATNLVNCDQTTAMPQMLFDFIANFIRRNATKEIMMP